MSPVVSRGLAQISLEDPEHMRTLAEQAAEELADAPAEEVIRWAVDTFGDRICVTSSMTDAVIIHLASGVHPGIDVVFLDTGYHFAETIGTRDAVEVVYPIHLINVTPSRTVAEQDAELGPRLFGRNPDLCCYLRKVEPLERALTNYDAWITGVRRDETNNRRQTQVVEWDDRREMVKVNPIVSWTQKQVDDFITTNGVLVNPLSTRATPRSAARPARSGSRRARTRAAGGGRGPARRSAAYMPEPVLVAVAHGSADPRASATIGELMAGAAERAAARGLRALEARTAFLGHAPPSLPQVMGTIEPGRQVRVLPLLLTSAYHSKADIPRMLARVSVDFPRLQVSYGATLGPHPLLLSALERRLAEADPRLKGLTAPGPGSSSRRRAPAIRRPTPPSRASRRSGRPAPGGSPSARPTPRPPIPRLRRR